MLLLVALGSRLIMVCNIKQLPKTIKTFRWNLNTNTVIARCNYFNNSERHTVKAIGDVENHRSLNTG